MMGRTQHESTQHSEKQVDFCGIAQYRTCYETDGAHLSLKRFPRIGLSSCSERIFRSLATSSKYTEGTATEPGIAARRLSRERFFFIKS